MSAMWRARPLTTDESPELLVDFRTHPQSTRMRPTRDARFVPSIRTSFRSKRMLRMVRRFTTPRFLTSPGRASPHHAWRSPHAGQDLSALPDPTGLLVRCVETVDSASPCLRHECHGGHHKDIRGEERKSATGRCWSASGIVGDAGRACQAEFRLRQVSTRISARWWTKRVRVGPSGFGADGLRSSTVHVVENTTIVGV